MLMNCRIEIVLVALLSFIATVLPSPAWGQADVLPGSELPELRPFEPEVEAPAALDLPPIPTLEDEGSARLSMGLRVFVKAFRFEGSSVFSDEELERLTAPFSDREINSEELLRARDAITDHYIEHGYLTSGAYIPDQDADDGIVAIRAVEGVLTDV